MSTTERPGLEAGDLKQVERAIVWPVVYASVFGAPLRSSRLWSRMVGTSASESEMQQALAGLVHRGLLKETEGFVWLRDRYSLEAHADSLARERATTELLSRGQQALAFLTRLRSVSFAGLSGGCAHDAADDGDIDIFVVTAPGALWRTLLATTLVAKARGWRRTLCLNYLVDTTALRLPQTDFYTAFEMISLRPLKGEEVFNDLLAANDWAAPIFPNFFQSRLRRQNPLNRNRIATKGAALEAAARMIHRPYLRHRLPSGPGVQLWDHAVRLHTTDHRERVRVLFEAALHTLGVEPPPWI